MPDLMTQAAYAKTRGVSKQAIGDLVRRGIIRLVDGKIDPAYADHQRSLSLNPAKSKSMQLGAEKSPNTRLAPGPASPVTNMTDYQRERAERERLERLTAQLAYDKAIGAVLDRAGTLRAITEATRAMRDRLVGVGRRVAADVAGCGSAAEAERRIDDEHRAVLDLFAADLAKLVEAGESDG